MPQSFTSREINGVIYTDENDPSGVGCLLLLLGLVFIAVVIAQVIYVKTGASVFDMLDGITGPCGTCTTPTEGN